MESLGRVTVRRKNRSAGPLVRRAGDQGPRCRRCDADSMGMNLREIRAPREPYRAIRKRGRPMLCVLRHRNLAPLWLACRLFLGWVWDAAALEKLGTFQLYAGSAP